MIYLVRGTRVTFKLRLRSRLPSVVSKISLETNVYPYLWMEITVSEHNCMNVKFFQFSLYK